MIKLGTNSIGKIYLGTNSIGRAYLGSNLVFQRGASPTPPTPSEDRLPDGYTERAYVLTHSTAWIDTGVAGATDLEIAVRFEVGTYVQYAPIYANYVDESHKNCRAILSSSTALLVGGGNNKNTTVSNFSLNRVHTLIVNSSTAYLESVSTAISASSDTENTTNICLGSTSVTNPNTSRDISLRLYAFSIKKAGVLILNYVPCTRDSDSKPGFYDLVANSFVPSSSSVDFTAGPVAEYSDNLLKCLDWDGTTTPTSSGNWYDTIGNMRWEKHSGTHGTDYFQCINSTPSSVSQYMSLYSALPDLGYHWKIVADIAIRTQASNPASFVPIDFGSLGGVGDGSCSFSFLLAASSGRWGYNAKFNGSSQDAYGLPSNFYNIDSETITTSEEWIRRTVTIGVRASSTSGKDEGFVEVSGHGSAVSNPFTPLRFNRWETGKSHIGRSNVNPSSTYPYATSCRIYSIKVYYAPEERELTHYFQGKNIAIIGDSISTYNAEGYKYDSYSMYYPYGEVNSVEYTYWKKLMNDENATLEVNLSYSGSCACSRSGYVSLNDRIGLIGNADTVIIALGTNDSAQSKPLGDYLYDASYSELGETNFREAYIKGIKGLLAANPNITIVCAIFSMGDDYRNSIKAIAQHYNLKWIDCGNNYSKVQGVHPNIAGMIEIEKHFLYD